MNAANDRCDTPLHWAVLAQSEQQLGSNKIAMLIERGAHVNVADEQGETPLHLASRLNKKEHTNALMEAHADVFAFDKEGHSACHRAEMSYSEVQLLLWKKLEAIASSVRLSFVFLSIVCQSFVGGK